MSFKLQFEKAYTIKLSGDYTSTQALESFKYNFKKEVPDFPNKYKVKLIIDITEVNSLSQEMQDYLMELGGMGAEIK